MNDESDRYEIGGNSGLHRVLEAGSAVEAGVIIEDLAEHFLGADPTKPGDLVRATFICPHRGASTSGHVIIAHRRGADLIRENIVAVYWGDPIVVSEGSSA